MYDVFEKVIPSKLVPQSVLRDSLLHGSGHYWLVLFLVTGGAKL